jgi:hypothetical protein
VAGVVHDAVVEGDGRHEGGGEKHVLGRTFGPDNPDWEKLSGKQRTFDMITGEE